MAGNIETCNLQWCLVNFTQMSGGQQPLSDQLEPEVFQEFAKKLCRSYDLVIASRGTAHLPVYDVGASLGNLNDSEIQVVVDDPEIPIRHDKAFQLLFNWKQKSKDNATWEHLVNCLKNLQDDSIMEKIHGYLQQMKHQTKGMHKSESVHYHSPGKFAGWQKIKIVLNFSY